VASAERRTRIIVVTSLAVALIVAVVGFVLVRRAGHRLDRQTADARLCTTAASSLELVNPNMASGAPNLALHTSRTTAGQVVSDARHAGASAHPWDQEPAGTVVTRCQAGNVTWLVDGKGHAGRTPAPR
jgi:hypothetical protein